MNKNVQLRANTSQEVHFIITNDRLTYQTSTVTALLQGADEPSVYSTAHRSISQPTCFGLLSNNKQEEATTNRKRQQQTKSSQEEQDASCETSAQRTLTSAGYTWKAWDNPSTLTVLLWFSFLKQYCHSCLGIHFPSFITFKLFYMRLCYTSISHA